MHFMQMHSMHFRNGGIMFISLYQCRIQTHLKDKQLLFWSFLFPILLGTLLYLAFGTAAQKESFQTIPIAYITESKPNVKLDQMLKILSENRENPLLQIQTTNLEEAKLLLEEEQIEGIILVSDPVQLFVKEEGIAQSILKTFLDNFIQFEQASLQADGFFSYFNTGTSFTKEISFQQQGDSSNYNYSLQYFYALLAFACMYCSFYGLDNAVKTQANFSPLAARKSVAPVHKLVIFLSEFLASLTIQLIQITIQFLYFTVVLGIDFGNQFGYIALTCFIGSITGISFGSFLGFLLPFKENTKIAILIGSTLFFSSLGGLMFANIIDIIEQYAPLINRINPAALISRMFYAIHIYESPSIFFENLICLSILSFLFILGSYFAVRRKKYASI